MCMLVMVVPAFWVLAAYVVAAGMGLAAGARLALARGRDVSRAWHALAMAGALGIGTTLASRLGWGIHYSTCADGALGPVLFVVWTIVTMVGVGGGVAVGSRDAKIAASGRLALEGAAATGVIFAALLG